MHRSKGAEWPVVFVPGLDDGTVPVRWATSPWGARRAAALLEQQLAEERRLLYVALSRAIHRLYCCVPATRQQGDRLVVTRPSRFLARLPPGSLIVRTSR
jgi:DNA helicase-2/ATP-dependent DNA helicase PcrA